MRAWLSRRVGAGFHFAGVVVRVVGAVKVAGQPGFGRLWSLPIAWVMTSLQGHRGGKAEPVTAAGG